MCQGSGMEYDECVRIIERAAKQRATELDLSSKDLHELPSEIGKLTHLEKLDLTNNFLVPHTNVCMVSGNGRSAMQ